MQRVDDIDFKLLKLLHEDSRKTLRELGREVGLSLSAVRKRLEKLERAQVIRRYTVTVDHRRLGLGLTAFLNLEVEPKDLKDFIRRLSCRREVCEVHRITGDYNLLVKVRARDMASLNKLLGNLTDSSGSVRKIETFVAIESFKEGGSGFS